MGQDLISSPLIFSQQKYAQAVKFLAVMQSCAFIKCEAGSTFTQNGENFRITRLIQGGSCSIKVFEVVNLRTSELLIVKVKSVFKPVELQNYVDLKMYVDFFPVRRFELMGQTFLNVQALVQKKVPGEKLGVALHQVKSQAAKDLIIYNAINALCKLHKQHFVHQDPLPNNCIWDDKTQQATFVDYDVMQPEHELSTSQFNIAVVLDLKRLLFGCITKSNSRIKGLSHYTSNMLAIIASIPADLMATALKEQILLEMENDHALQRQDGSRHDKLRVR